MKISCNRRDEILKQKQAWESERDEAMKQSNKEDQAFRNAELAVTDPIKKDLEHMLSQYRTLKFDVRVNRELSNMLAVSIECNEYNKFDDNVALSWSYKAVMSKDGEVTKETSSWSGLKAVTEAQMQSLTETLEALKYLNSIDWATLLKKDLPKYKDYYKTDTSKYTRDVPNFDEMLLEADIEESIGKDVLLVGGSSVNQRGYPIGKAYYMILKETPSQYEIAMIPGYSLDDDDVDIKSIVEKNKKYSYRIRKDKLIQLLNKPIETVEV